MIARRFFQSLFVLVFLTVVGLPAVQDGLARNTVFTATTWLRDMADGGDEPGNLFAVGVPRVGQMQIDSDAIYLPIVYKQWQPPVPLIIAGEWATRVVGHPRSETIYALTAQGLHRSDDGAQTWTQMNASPPVTESLVIAPSQPDVLYGGEGYPCYRGGPDVMMFKSMDGGESWSELPEGLNLEPLAVHPQDPQRVYARGCDGPWLSNYGGEFWVRQGDPLFRMFGVIDIAPAPSDDWQSVYLSASTEGGGGAIIGSHRHGSDWQRLTPQDPDLWYVETLAVDPISSTHVYFGEPHAFWGSEDGGTTWFTSTTGLEEVVYDPAGPTTQDVGLLSLAYSPLDLDTWILGTVRGLYVTHNRGRSWIKLAGFPWDRQPVTGLLLRWLEPRKLLLTTPLGIYIYRMPD